LILALLIFGTIFVAAAQEPKSLPASPPADNKAPAAATTFKATSRLVLLDVVVTDLNGQFASGLTRSDFTVLEDGKPQSITSFEAPAEHPRNPISGDQAPVNILVLDELNTKFADMAYARSQLVHYLRKQPAQLRQASALAVLNNYEFKVLRNYTRDRDQLLEDLKKHSPNLPWKMQKGFQTERLDRSLLALQQIAAATIGIPGRKTLIWVGVGFPSRNLIGLNDEIKATIENGINLTINRLLEARVTMYPIDPTMMDSLKVTAAMDTGDPDVGSVSMMADDPFDSDVNLANFGPATGGRSFHWRNDIDEVIQSSADDGAKYYTMAYIPTNRSDDTKFRAIHIKLRPGLVARTRNGYYPVDAPLTKDMVTLDIQQAAFNSFPYTAVPITVTGKANPETATCTLYINSQSLSWQTLPNGDAHAQIRVGMASFSADGKMLHYEGIERAVTTPAADFKALMLRPVVLHVQTQLSKGAKRLRYVVRDDTTGHMGAVDLDPANIPTVAAMPKRFSEQ
jgi:VWFA-related protein